MLLFIIIVLLFVLGEELSWGQHIFKWKAAGVFESHNYQKETNLHNFINPILPVFYPIVGTTILIFMISFWFFPGRISNSVYNVFLPPPVFLVVLFYMAASGFLGQTEIFETYFSIFFLLYSISFFSTLKSYSSHKIVDSKKL